MTRANGGELLTGDAYLAKIRHHTASTGGTTGAALSLTTDKSIAKDIARNPANSNKIYSIVEIDSARVPKDAFKTIARIIVEEGDRLVNKRLVDRGTLWLPIMQLDTIEKELFYLGGDIPRQMIISAYEVHGEPQRLNMR